MTWQPDWQYLHAHMLWLHEVIREHLDAGEITEAEARLRECEEILRQLEMWTQGRGLD